MMRKRGNASKMKRSSNYPGSSIIAENNATQSTDDKLMK